MSTRENEIRQLQRQWAEDDRWQGIKRGYTAEEVIRLRGSLTVEHTLARRGAEKLWRLADNIAGAAGLLDDHAERIRFAGICEHAGAVAKTSAAYASAARQF